MKFVHTADWHIGSLRNQMPDDYLERAESMLRQVYTTAEHKADGVVVVAGDMFDSKVVTNSERDLLLTTLANADNLGIKTIAINGNHDIIAPKTSNVRWLSILCDLKKMPNTVIADCRWRTVRLRGISFVLFPPCERDDPILTSEKIGAYLKKRDLRKSICVSHFPVDGAMGDNGRPLDGRRFSDVLFGDRVAYWALGDAHLKQEVSPCVWYCGSPIPHTRREEPPKGVLIVDTNAPDQPAFEKIQSKPLESYKALTEHKPSKPRVEAVEVSVIQEVDPYDAIPREVTEYMLRKGMSKRAVKPFVRYVKKALSDVKRHK